MFWPSFLSIFTAKKLIDASAANPNDFLFKTSPSFLSFFLGGVKNLTSANILRLVDGNEFSYEFIWRIFYLRIQLCLTSNQSMGEIGHQHIQALQEPLAATISLLGISANL